MTYKEETYVLDTLKEIQETIRSPEFKQNDYPRYSPILKK